jgi:hypothetical protein
MNSRPSSVQRAKPTDPVNSQSMVAASAVVAGDVELVPSVANTEVIPQATAKQASWVAARPSSRA